MAKGAKRKPTFRRGDYWRYKKLGSGWKKPRGRHNKMRTYLGGKPLSPSIGYRGKASERGLHPSGYTEILVENPFELEGLDGKKHAVRIAAGVGKRKARAIMEKSEGMGLKVLNPRRLVEAKAEGEMEVEAKEVEEAPAKADEGKGGEK